MLRRFVSSVVVFGMLLVVMRPAAAEFPLKDGDIWVMAGDSITAQHQHSNYFEAFCFARYPKLKFAFRNSGVGGHTIPTTLARFDYDIAAWKPTVVSVELGMNDQGGTPTDKFIANMKTMLERIGSVGARPVILTASPVNDGTAPPTSKTQNRRLDEYANELKKLAEERKIPFADQFHPLVVIWAKNKPQEILLNLISSAQAVVQNEQLAGKEHLQAFLAAQPQHPLDQPLSMQGDPVHPGPNGQLMMAAELLKGLGAEPFVSSVTIDATGKLVEAKGCTVTDLKREGDTITFTRLDESLPFPIPDGTVEVLKLDPTIEAMSLYMLKVEGLPKGMYTVKVDDAQLAHAYAAEFIAKGVNLTNSAHRSAQGWKVNPILTQSRAILAAVSAKAGLVGQWRALSKQAQEPGTDHKASLADLEKRINEADDKIRAAAQPKKLRFEISRRP